MDKHLFILNNDVVRASMFNHDLMDTVADLREMDLFRLPYERNVYVKLLSGSTEIFHPHMQIVCGPYGKDQGAHVTLSHVDGGDIVDALSAPEVRETAVGVCAILKAVLIVLLATKNATKVTTVNKLAKLGIGKKNSFATTTTISLPHDLPDDPDNPATGKTKAAHLRRGHIRRQRYGSGYQLEKKIWIAPVFVNADPDFVNSRRDYTFSGQLGQVDRATTA